jgi:magnesium chelatase subunit D
MPHPINTTQPASAHPVNPRPAYPFPAIVGQDSFRQALLLAAIDPSLGGVLVMGDKGSGKTTTVRALAALLPEPSLFVNLPVGATEDRVLGSADLEQLINHRRMSVQKGLLAAAHNGILYIDEINLLNDYIMDALLDASASGGYYLERDGLSAWQDSRFILVGTMNPEEGQLRPQLLDRFGLCVTVTTPVDPAQRAEITRRRLAFDTDPDAFTLQYSGATASLRQAVSAARTLLSQVIIPDDLYKEVALLCLEQNAEGMRADILIIKAARALAASNNRTTLTLRDIGEVAPLVLAHRSGNPPSGRPPSDGPPSSHSSSNHPPPGDSSPHTRAPGNDPPSHDGAPPTPNGASSGLQEYLFHATALTQKLTLPTESTTRQASPTATAPLPAHLRPPASSPAQRDLLATLRHYLIHGRLQVLGQPSHRKTPLRLTLLVDSSSSMAAAQQVSRVKGLLTATLRQTKYRQVRIAVIALLQGVARLVTGFTDNKELVLGHLDRLPTGGRTNMKAGFRQVDLLLRHRRQDQGHYLYIFTDGRINAGETKEPFAEAVRFYQRQLNHLRSTTCIIDTETGIPRLGMARQLATVLNVGYRRP